MSWDEQPDGETEAPSLELAERELEEGEVLFEGEEPTESEEEKQLRERCRELEAEGERLKELYLRKLADFENYRKRQEREMEEFKRLANAGLIRDCLPVVDNLERALLSGAADTGGLRTGIELVLRQFKDVLGRHGLAEVDPAGQPFDPTLHEAIQRRESAEVPEHSVVQVMQKGYLLGERLLRPALVVVAVRPPAVAEATKEPEPTTAQATGEPGPAAEQAKIPDPFSEDHNG